MSNQTFDGPQAAIVVYGLIFFVTLLCGLRRRLAIRGCRRKVSPPSANPPAFEQLHPGQTAQLRFMGNRRFALELSAPSGPDHAIAEFEATSWSSAKAEAKRLLPGMFVFAVPDSAPLLFAPRVAN
jgi:hypothetical protein